MKNIINRMVVALVLCALTSVVALADKTSKEVTFYEDVKVNGTLVKKGTYKVAFDEQTSELTIAKNKKNIAKTSARMEKNSGHQRAVYSTKQGSNILFSITLNDDNRAVITEGNGQSTGAQ